MCGQKYVLTLPSAQHRLRVGTSHTASIGNKRTFSSVVEPSK